VAADWVLPSPNNSATHMAGAFNYCPGKVVERKLNLRYRCACLVRLLQKNWN